MLMQNSYTNGGLCHHPRRSKPSQGEWNAYNTHWSWDEFIIGIFVLVTICITINILLSFRISIQKT